MYIKHGISLPKQFKIELALNYWQETNCFDIDVVELDISKKVWCINLPWSKYMGTWFKYVARHINNNYYYKLQLFTKVEVAGGGNLPAR